VVAVAELVPIISVWELKVGEHYVPDVTPQETTEHPLLKVHP